MKITEIGHRISDRWPRFKARCWRALGHLAKPAILVMLGIGGFALLYPTSFRSFRHGKWAWHWNVTATANSSRIPVGLMLRDREPRISIG
jgi:hypothetical protein